MTHRELFKQYLSDKKQLIVGAVADPSTLSVTITACDIVELRLDSLGTDTDVVHFSEKCPLPLIVTARGPEEGGQCDWSIEKRIDAYRALLPHAALIDIELHDFDIFDEVIAEAKELGIYVIGSFHNFTTTPPPLSLVEKIDPRADIHKFALMARSKNDIKSHLDVFDHLSGHTLSVMGMGPLGAAARPLMAEAGSILNYGFLGATPTAPNQWPAELLKATLAI